jgi:hypothetical protein
LYARGSAEDVINIGRAHEGHVPPIRTLERGNSIRDVHGVLGRSLPEHGPEVSGDKRITSTDRIDYLDTWSP